MNRHRSGTVLRVPDPINNILTGFIICLRGQAQCSEETRDRYDSVDPLIARSRDHIPFVRADLLKPADGFALRTGAFVGIKTGDSHVKELLVRKM